MRTLLTILVMVTVAPVVAVTTLVCWNPERWGGSINPLAIIAMALFGLFTIPLWPTYIPAIALTPFIMNRIAALPTFKQLPLPVVLSMSLFIGAPAGIGVISIIVPWHESSNLILNWVSAGAVSGAVTLVVIALIYRKPPAWAEPGAAPNGGSAMPPPILRSPGGPPSAS